jgi:hypothetical protein
MHPSSRCDKVVELVVVVVVVVVVVEVGKPISLVE